MMLPVQIPHYHPTIREYKPKNEMEDPMKDVQMGNVCPDLPCSLIFSGVDNKFWRGGDAIHKQQVYSESYMHQLN
jgi:hypothetical protein